MIQSFFTTCQYFGKEQLSVNFVAILFKRFFLIHSWPFVSLTIPSFTNTKLWQPWTRASDLDALPSAVVPYVDCLKWYIHHCWYHIPLPWQDWNQPINHLHIYIKISIHLVLLSLTNKYCLIRLNFGCYLSFSNFSINFPHIFYLAYIICIAVRICPRASCLAALVSNDNTILASDGLCFVFAPFWFVFSAFSWPGSPVTPENLEEHKLHWDQFE